MQTWLNLAKAAAETKYWPLIRGGVDDFHEQAESNPGSILAAVPEGSIREILKTRTVERQQSLAEMIPEAAGATDLDHLAQLADASGIYRFIGSEETTQPWPTEAPERVSLHSIR